MLLLNLLLSRIICLLICNPLVVLFLPLLELGPFLILFGVQLFLLLLIFLVKIRLSRADRGVTCCRRNFVGVNRGGWTSIVLRPVGFWAVGSRAIGRGIVPPALFGRYDSAVAKGSWFGSGSDRWLSAVSRSV